jgi:hypothetical protein
VERLIADVKALRLDKDLPNEDFRARLRRDFVQGIPLTDSVIVDAGNASIIVPVVFDELRPSDQSRLFVAFRAQPDADPEADGTMRLKPLAKVPSGRYQGGVTCQLAGFQFRDVVVPEAAPGDPRVVTILAAPSVKRIFVFMERFERQPGTIILSP